MLRLMIFTERSLNVSEYLPFDCCLICALSSCSIHLFAKRLRIKTANKRIPKTANKMPLVIRFLLVVDFLFIQNNFVRLVFVRMINIGKKTAVFKEKTRISFAFSEGSEDVVANAFISKSLRLNTSVFIL